MHAFLNKNNSKSLWNLFFLNPTTLLLSLAYIAFRSIPARAQYHMPRPSSLIGRAPYMFYLYPNHNPYRQHICARSIFDSTHPIPSFLLLIGDGVDFGHLIFLAWSFFPSFRIPKNAMLHPIHFSCMHIIDNLDFSFLLSIKIPIFAWLLSSFSFHFRLDSYGFFVF
jgi:hypothetical protein